MPLPHRTVRATRAAIVRASAVALLAACGDAGRATSPGVDPRDGARPPAPPPSTATLGNPMAGAPLWVDAISNARRTADAWRATRPADAAQLDKIATASQVRWFGNWNTAVRADVDAATTTIIRAGALPVFVAYNLPQRDCGGLSGGSTTTPDAYRTWIAAFAAGIGSRRAAVILEPDALAGMDCLSPADQQLRFSLFRQAIQALTASGTVTVYLDAGNPHWRSAPVMASRLLDAGIASTQGFALNVSNFVSTPDNVAYGTALSTLVGGKHFVIDTGRNGTPGSPAWCNPALQSLGLRPTTSTGIALLDATLWVKAPGESDGPCNGASASGEWMPEYALGLAQRAAY